MDAEKEIMKIKVRVEQNHAMLKGIRRHMRIQSAFGGIKLLIFVIPIILALIYLPQLFQQYKDFTDSIQQNASIIPTLPEGFDINSIQELLKNPPSSER